MARAKEAAFFRGHPAYAGAANTGTDFLSRRLEAQLVRAIQARLPTIRSAVDNGCAVGFDTLAKLIRAIQAQLRTTRSATDVGCAGGLLLALVLAVLISAAHCMVRGHHSAVLRSMKTRRALCWHWRVP